MVLKTDMLRSPLRPALSPALRHPLEPGVGGAPLSLTAQTQAIAQISGRVAGVYDTQDLTTMYSSRTGSTLIGTPGNGTAQFVGRWEDISQGRVLGSDRLSGAGSFPSTSGWVPDSGCTLSASGGVLTVTTTGDNTFAVQRTGVYVIGESFLVEFTYSANAATTIRLRDSGTTFWSETASLTPKFISVVVTPLSSTTFEFGVTGGTVTAFTVSGLTVKKNPGHHALAPNDTTGRPQLSARVNLLTYSEDLSNAAWPKTRLATVVSNTLIATAVSDTHFAQQSTMDTGVSYSWYAEVEDVGARYFAIGQGVTLTRSLIVDLQTGLATYTGATVTGVSIVARTGGGWVIRASYAAAATAVLTIGPSASGSWTVLGDGVAGVRVHRIDSRPTNIHAAGSIPAYQRVVDAETYDSVGFPYRFIPNGTGQAFQTSTITPGSDSVTVVSGIRTLRDANEIVIESSPSVDANQGAIQLARISSNIYRSVSVGSGTVVQANSGSVPFPLTTVLTHTSDISQPSVRLSRNPGDAVENTGSQGSGNYLAYPINIFSRNSALFWFGGQGFRQFICFGPALSAGETATVESWVNESAKAY
jgi:hypothetical protein